MCIYTRTWIIFWRERKCYGKSQMFLTFSVRDAFLGPNFDSYRCIFDSYHDISPIVPWLTVVHCRNTVVIFIGTARGCMGMSSPPRFVDDRVPWNLVNRRGVFPFFELWLYGKKKHNLQWETLKHPCVMVISPILLHYIYIYTHL